MSEKPINAFLRGLSEEALKAITPHLELVTLRAGDYCHLELGAVDFAYFPQTAVISEISVDDSGREVETSVVGNEGASSLLEACGSQVASANCVIQVGGAAHRLSAERCRKLWEASSEFRTRAMAFFELQAIQCRQSCVCRALHPIENRLARWIAECFERSGGQRPLPLTQEFLAAMLGVQRNSVTPCAMKLQDDGAIRYSRGRVEVIDSERLDALACTCLTDLRLQRARLGFPTSFVEASPT